MNTELSIAKLILDASIPVQVSVHNNEHLKFSQSSQKVTT